MDTTHTVKCVTRPSFIEDSVFVVEDRNMRHMNNGIEVYLPSERLLVFVPYANIVSIVRSF